MSQPVHWRKLAAALPNQHRQPVDGDGTTRGSRFEKGRRSRTVNEIVDDLALMEVVGVGPE